MGTFSIWHWLIVLSVFGAPVIAIASASRAKTLSRLPYFWRIAGLLLAGVILALYIRNQPAGSADAATSVLGLLWFVGLVIFGVFQALWSVHRIQEIGRSRWWALLLLVPTVNLVFLAFLVFYPGQESVEPGGDDTGLA